jgi:pyrroloquinoline-quinone synthase
MLLEEVDRLIEGRSLLDHPFYTKWAAGTLPVGALREYARQYYAFESSFPRFLSALHSRCDAAHVRAALLENLWDEEHGEANHAELWLRFAEGLGVSREDVRGAGWNDATRDLVASYRRLAFEGPVAAGVAALYAYEKQVPRVAASKIDGLRKFYGITGGPALQFFEVHASLDVEHSGQEARIVEDLGAGHETEVLEAASGALDAWWRFLDAVDPKPTPGEGRVAIEA